MAGAALLKHCRQILCMKCMNTADHQLIVALARNTSNAMDGNPFTTFG